MRLAGAIDIGGTRTKIGVVREDGSIVTHTSIATLPDGDTLVAAIATALRPMLDDMRVAGTLPVSVGVSVAGFLNPEHTRMFGNANLPTLCDYELRRELERALGLDCVLEVDSNAATVAEYRFGAGRGSRRLLALTIGTGVGGGVILDGALLRYTGECAGDLGHVIVSVEGRKCTCGATGCLEAMVCAAALSERTGGMSVAEILRAAGVGEQRSRTALAEAGMWLGVGLASLVSQFLPDRIVVGGGVGVAGDLLLGFARASYHAYAPTALKDVAILGSAFDGWEGIVGAASQALNPMG
ncbi:MAG TPA: ROK family protein [Gemmatimonadaceae bacterium]|nr:ROK family protein [Gemmatimonadaceae bacterium]